MTTPSDFPQRPSDEELAAHFASEASADVQLRIEGWRAHDPDAFHQAKRAWAVASAPRYRANTAAFEQRMMALVRADASARPFNAINRHRTHAKRWTVVSAALTAVAVVAMIPLVFGRMESRRAPELGTVHTTRTGQSALITLTDGSQVMLAPASQLRVAPGFGKSSRELSLVGEAYFTVINKRDVPFMVHTGTTVTRVLGTTFAVRRYATEGATQVSVETGKVVVTNHTLQHPSVTLAAGYVGNVTDSTAVSALADLAPYTGWRSGQLVFRDIPAREVLTTLERWYGYDFQLTDSSLARQPVTLRISTQPSPGGFAVLKAVLDVEMKITGTHVVLRPRTSVAAPAPIRESRAEVGR